MNGMVEGVKNRVAAMQLAGVQGQVVFQMTKEQYDMFAADLTELGVLQMPVPTRPRLTSSNAVIEVKV